jgi:hypothetical protein
VALRVSEEITRNVSYSWTFAISAIIADKTLLIADLFVDSSYVLFAQYLGNLEPIVQIIKGGAPY